MPPEPKKRRGPAEGKGHNVLIRIPWDLLEALDAEVEEMKRERPGFMNVTRTDLIRDVLYQHIKARGEAKKPPKR